ncbi:MAG TPA: membrane protein insertion efficiency factor YidD [Terriglobales bacterium]|nr:membrane protein insertion efficiency factor YidD [Terriglobales bacterium]
MKRRLQALGSGLQVIAELPSAILLFGLSLYKRLISPFFLPACRYVPTCSEYAAEAIVKHGAIRGTLMGAWRLLRCNPFVKGGFDPVPDVRRQSARRATHHAQPTAACNH